MTDPKWSSTAGTSLEIGSVGSRGRADQSIIDSSAQLNALGRETCEDSGAGFLALRGATPPFRHLRANVDARNTNIAARAVCKCAGAQRRWEEVPSGEGGGMFQQGLPVQEYDTGRVCRRSAGRFSRICWVNREVRQERRNVQQGLLGEQNRVWESLAQRFV